MVGKKRPRFVLPRKTSDPLAKMLQMGTPTEGHAEAIAGIEEKDGGIVQRKLKEKKWENDRRPSP